MAFRRALASVRRLRERGVPVAVISQVSSGSMGSLESLWDVLRPLGIYAWQVQLAIPYGRASALAGLLPDRVEVATWVMRFAQRFAAEIAQGSVVLADSVGYLHPLLGDSATGLERWHGCQAGLLALGIDSDGGVRGCLSLQAAEFLEGNVRARSLVDVWLDPGSFRYNRQPRPITSDACATCRLVHRCRGGCSSLRHAHTGTLGAAPYCVLASCPPVAAAQTVGTCVVCGHEGRVDSRHCDRCGAALE